MRFPAVRWTIFDVPAFYVGVDDLEGARLRSINVHLEGDVTSIDQETRVRDPALLDEFVARFEREIRQPATLEGADVVVTQRGDERMPPQPLT